MYVKIINIDKISEAVFHFTLLDPKWDYISTKIFGLNQNMTNACHISMTFKIQSTVTTMASLHSKSLLTY